MSFQELMETGGAEERRKVEELQKELQCDDPINIQFTSVSFALKEVKVREGETGVILFPECQNNCGVSK